MNRTPDRRASLGAARVAGRSVVALATVMLIGGDVARAQQPVPAPPREPPPVMGKPPLGGKGQAQKQVPRLAKEYEVKVGSGFRLVAAQQVGLGLPTVLDLSRFHLRSDERSEGARRTSEQFDRIKTGALHSGGYDITLGSDEQIAAWLLRRDVDAAVLPTGALILQESLGTALGDAMPRPSADEKGVNPADFEKQLCLAAYADGAQLPRKAALERWRDLGNLCREGVAASDWKGVTSGWRLVVQGPLSTRGFLVPALHLEGMAQVTPKMTTEARGAFWSQLSRIMIFVPNGAMPPREAGPRYGRPGETTFVFAPDAALETELEALGFHYEASALTQTRPAIVRSAEAGNPRVRQSASPGPMLFDDGPETEWLTVLSVAYLRSALHGWMTDNLRKAEWGPTSFLYSLREAALLAKHDAIASGNDALALVLSGGGVKAAYQSALIDGLYGIDGETPALLANVGSEGDPQQRLRVQWVSGNSGGALLGAFVATLGSDSIKRLRAAKTTLSDVIWKQRPSEVEGPTLSRKSEFVSTTDVLPFFDLMRWLSLIAAAFVLCFVLMFRRHPFQEEPKAAPEVSSRIRAEGFFHSLLWITLLVVAPLVIRWYTGKAGEEHVPYIQGFVYFTCVFIAIGSDQSRDYEMTRRHVTPDKPGLRLNRTRRARALSLIGFAIVVLVALQLLRDWPLLSYEVPLLPFISYGALLGTVAVLAAFWGVHRALQVWEPVDGLERPHGFRRVLAFSALPFMILVAYGLCWLAFGTPTILELTTKFWIQWLTVSVVVALAARIVFDAIARRAAGPQGRSWQKRVAALYRDLLTREDGRFLRLPRYFRIFVFLALGFGWWNLVMAPGVYGNTPARTFLAQRFRDLIGVHSLRDRKEIEKGLRLRAGFVVPTVSLGEGTPHYFEFRADDGAAGRDDHEGSPVESRPARGWELWPTPAAIAAAPEADFGHIADCVQPIFDAVVASGSPFPVFPPHLVNNPFCDSDDSVLQRYGIRTSLENDTWLVDGGFAHNIPIESARVVGARQVLVVESSVRGTLPEPVGPARPGLVGNLASNIGRIVPFLWEHAQASDVRRIEDLFVLHASPEPEDAAKWPFLGDFRGASIEICLSQGRTEVQNHHRIVTIDSPGRALFRREPR